MEVCTAGAVVVPDGRIDRALVLLRRIGVVVGVLFGLGLIAAVVADRAAAEERGGSGSTRSDAGGTSGIGGLGGLLQPLTTPVTDTVVTPLADAVVKPVANVVKPVADAVVKPLAPVVGAVVEPLAPVVRPVVALVAPVTGAVLRPVVAAVSPVLDPVLDAVVPVTEPLLAPVLHAAEPIVASVTGATGLAGVTDAVAGDVSRQAGAAPVDRSLPAPAAGSQAVPLVPSATAVARWSAHGVTTAGAATSSSFVHSGPSMAPVSPAPTPVSPGTPIQLAVTGGGSVGGSGGAHGADALVSGPDRVVSQQDTYGRSPPGTIVGVAWFAYDDRDHPS